jgi:hypothetical protein
MFNLISNTKTTTGLTVTCIIDHRKYKTGLKISDDKLNSIKIKKLKFHGEWNYKILPS